MAEQQRVFYKAIVCSEPTGLGGIKIRIPEVHGIPQMSENWLKFEELPYAYPASQIMSEDYGQKMFPLIGTQVYVAPFDNSRYIYFGSAIPSTYYTTVTSIRDVFLGQNVELNQPYSLNTMPYETVVFKSLKGSTIEVSDQDLAEYIRIVGPQGGFIELGNKGYVNSRRGQMLETTRAKPNFQDLSRRVDLDTYINIDDGKGNKISINKDGVEINCKKFKLVADETEGI